MKRIPSFILFAALLAAILCSCGQESGHFEAGKRYLASGNRTEAIAQFELALQQEPSDEIQGAAHWELARLYDEQPATRVRALWHYQEAVNGILPESVSETSASNALLACQKAVYADLRRAIGDDMTERTLRQKISLLEDHARQQSVWLKELRDENERLIKKLAAE